MSVYRAARSTPAADSIQSIYSALSTRFAPYSDTPSLDAQVLLAYILEKPRSWVLAHPETRLASNQRQALEKAVAKLEAGTPLPYVLGNWEFYGLSFVVTPEVLIPRPETELLVERALVALRNRPRHPRVVDLGTGSGCIAVSLAVHAPHARIIASDVSFPALRVARQNAQRHRVQERITFLQTDLLPPTLREAPAQTDTSRQPPIDLICANLPYIPTDRLHSLPVHEREPTLALDGGVNGLDLIQRLISEAEEVLAPDGVLLMEIDSQQSRTIPGIVKRYFPQANMRILPDLAGRDRLVVVSKEESA